MSSTETTLERETAAAVAELAVVTDRLCLLVAAGGLSTIPAGSLPDLTTALHGANDRITSVAVAASARLHRSGILPIATTRWLQSSAGLGAAAAAATLARGCALQETYLPTAAAWLAGEISGAHVGAITQAIDRAARSVPALDKPRFRADAEQALLAFAKEGARPSELSVRGRRLRLLVDPDGLAVDALETERAQFLRFSPDAEGVTVTGFLSVETHALITTALQQIVDTQHRQGHLRERDRIAGDDPVARRQRRLRRPHLHALALRQLCGSFLESGQLGSHHGVIPRVRVDVDLVDLHTAFGGTVHAPGSDAPVLVGPDSVRRLLCDAEISAALVSGARPRCTCGCGCGSTPGEVSLDDLVRAAAADVLYVGRAQRIVTTRQRRALEIRDRHCTGPGCTVEVSRCAAHHVVHWEDGGSTDLSNLVLACDGCHHLVHEGGWSILVTPGKQPHQHGYLTWLPPDRREP
jgi:hypothetical protein